MTKPHTLSSFTVADLKAAPEGITASHCTFTFEFTETPQGECWTNYSMKAPCGHVYRDDSLSYLKACARTWAAAEASDEDYKNRVRILASRLT